MSWKNKSIQIGTVKEGDSIEFHFEHDRLENGLMTSITPSCGACTKILGFDIKGLKVKFKAGNIPKHLGLRPTHSFTKKIAVEYTTGEKDILYFSGVILRR